MPSPLHHTAEAQSSRQRRHHPIRKMPGKVEMGLFTMVAVLYAIV